MIDLNKISKKQLIQIVDFYEKQLQILDLMLSDMSNITLETVNTWLDDTTNTAEVFYKKTKVNNFDEQYYKQVEMFGGLQ